MVKTKLTFSDITFKIVLYFVLVFAFTAVLIPIIHVVSSSFSSPQAIMSGQVFLLPVDVTLEGFEAVFSYNRIWSGYANSIMYTAVGTLFNVVLTIMIAYPLSRSDLVGRNPIMMMVTFTMLFSGGMVPTYIVVDSLNLVGTFWALIIPSAIGAYNVIIARTFFQQNIPDELLDAAQIDGASNFRFIRSMVLPLSKSVIAVITLFYAVGHWNSYFPALLYLRDESTYPLQMVLRSILIQNQTSEMMDTMAQAQAEYMAALLKYGTIVVAVLPMVILYPFIQKHFVKGVMIGSVKG